MSIAQKLTTIAENEPKVYDTGYKAGINAQHKAFWDVFQDEGKRTNYSRAFYGEGWTDKTFKPIYDIQPTNAYYMFCDSTISGDLIKILSEFGVSLDLSQATELVKCFAATDFTKIGEVNTTSAASLEALFLGSEKLETIDKLILKNDGSQNLYRMFRRCYALKNLTVSGVIGTALGLGHAPLSKASIESVIGAVSEAKAVTLTLNKSAVISAFGSASNAEWLALINTRPKCTVSLA